MKQGLRSGIAGVVGGFLFLLFYFVIVPDFLLVSVAAGAAGFVGAFFVLGGGSAAKKELGEDAFKDLDAKETLRLASAQEKELKSLASGIKNPRVREEIEDIADLVGRIVQDVRDDPSDFPKARQFFDYYLGATVKIIRKYAELLGKARSLKNSGSLSSVEDTLKQVKSAFEKQLQQLLENDVLDLDVELKVLKNTIVMEGLGEEPGETKTGSPAAGSGEGTKKFREERPWET